ncbi:MAG: alpha/beta fold hydrolase [Proteobacteria bacterium]|nr:alpha/beta fold hydrolase [Pseudomonadota bacterium]
MKRVLSYCLLLIAGVAVGCSSAPKGVTGPAGKGVQPPLIDRELFFGDPVITGAQLSPDGQYLAFIKPYKDVRNIWVKRLDEEFDSARPITADKRPVPGYFWSRDGRHILYVQDKGGNENYHVYAVDPSASPVAATGVPPARNLTDIEGVRARIYSAPRNDPNAIIVGLNDRDASYHDVYRIDIASGQRTLLIKNDHKVGYYFYDENGAVRLAVREIPGGSSEILRVESGDLVRIYTTTYEEDAFPMRFHSDGKRVYLETNKGSDVDLSRLMLMDVQTGKTELVEADPEGRVDFGWAVFHEETDELLATVYIGDRLRIYPKSEQTRRDLELLRGKFPDGDLRFRSATRDMRLTLVSVASDVDPGSTYLYNRDTGDIKFIYRSRPDLPSEHLAAMKPVRYEARDGVEIPAYLTLPKGAEPKNLPAVLFPHGGPWSRDIWGYDGFTQFLANRGYAVLQPNFRSSSGYGKKFLNAGNRTWGIGAMQHDLTDGVKWMIGQGIADPKRICIFGGSYGGYATLAGVTFTPDLYTCGIPYVAPSNLITLIESFPAYWRPFLESSWYKRVGDPADAADRKDLEARSPLNFVDQIKVPLLVVHGANDPRVKQAESDQIVVALRDKGHAVEYIVAPDEGHGFRAPNNRMAMAMAMERFLAKHLGGRVQTSVKDNVAGRLAEITVDIKTVEMPSVAEQAAATAAMRAALPNVDGSLIKPVALEFKANLKMASQNMEMTVTRTVQAVTDQGHALWRIVDSAKLPTGNVADTLDLDSATLRPVKRTMSGTVEAGITYSDKAVKGTMSVMGRKTDIDVALDAPVWADGPGLAMAVAALPLAEGYETTFRWFETNMQKVEPYRLVVKGTETTSVPAGNFETFVVEYIPLGDSTSGGVMRVMRKAPHYAVKSEHKLPGGMGVLTTELSNVK